MEVNTSDYVTSGILSIEYEDGKQRLVAFLSKFLNKIERNYNNRGQAEKWLCQSATKTMYHVPNSETCPRHV